MHLSDESDLTPPAEAGELPAGDFATWLTQMQGALRGEHGSEVPCGSCTACCTASQFVHIAPDETETLARIPPALLFAAPRLPPGHVVLGYDERGHCPMLVDNRCSIYEHRPRACRTYDCRVFPASGLRPEGEGKAALDRHVQRWRFSYATESSRVRHVAVRAAAEFLIEHPELERTSNTTALAVRAVEMHDRFLISSEVEPG